MGSIPGQVGTCAFVPLVSSGEWGDAAPVLYTMVAVILCAPGTVPYGPDWVATCYASVCPCMRKAHEGSGLHTWLHILAWGGTCPMFFMGRAPIAGYAQGVTDLSVRRAV